jgi:hypothetical protein
VKLISTAVSVWSNKILAFDRDFFNVWWKINKGEIVNDMDVVVYSMCLCFQENIVFNLDGLWNCFVGSCECGI